MSSGPDSPTLGADIATVPGARSQTPDAPMESTGRLGRYIVLEEVGRGGMGRVVRAYDPKLRREVALKVLADQVRADGEARIVREAQALAQLSHSNVLPVYDVHTSGAICFIAMEFVEGQTLRAWLREERRPWRDVLEKFRAAGAGLAAAHRAGLVHRDFKPSNVMVGRDGRVRVMDFGIARAAEGGELAATPPPSPTGPGARAAGVDLSMPLTLAGTVMGTSAYMAPEQHQGDAVDARSDEYAFCVALYEGLAGRRPFAGSNDAALLASKLEHDVVWRPDLPRFLRPVLVRGLDPQPDRRYPSIEALLDALDRDPRRARRRWLVAGLVVIAVTAFAVGDQVRERREIARCEAAGSAIAEVWSSERADHVLTSLRATGTTIAEDTAARLKPMLDDYAHSWTGVRERTCLEAEVHRTRSEELYEKTLECLDERRAHLEGLVEVFVDADDSTVRRAVSSAASLPSLEPCENDRWLLQRVQIPPDAQVRSEVAAARLQLAQARAMIETARYTEALALLEHVLETGPKWEPLRAEALNAKGWVEGELGRYEDAARDLEQAFVIAGRCGHDEVATDAVNRLVVAVGGQLARHREGLVWARQAEMMVGRLGQEGDLREANMLVAIASVHHTRGAFDDARVALLRGLAIRERVLGPSDLRVAAALNNLAAIAYERGAYEDARAAFLRTLEIFRDWLGPEHPEVAGALYNLGTVDYAVGAHADSLAFYEQALAIRERVFGREHLDVAEVLNAIGAALIDSELPDEALRAHQEALQIRQRTLGLDHPVVAQSLNNIGSVHVQLQRFELASAVFSRALEIFEHSLGPDHPSVGTTLNNLGNVHRHLGANREAIEAFSRGLAIFEVAVGRHHPLVATTLANLADTHRLLGNYDQSLALFERALVIWENALGPDHVQLSRPLIGMGLARLDTGRPQEAVAPLERAVELAKAGEGAASLLASSRFALARALWATSKDRSRAHTLATAARDGHRAKGDRERDAVAEVEAWLRNHPAE